jgi:hypothetical protein
MEDSTSIDQLMGMGMNGPQMASQQEMLPSMDIRDNIPSMDQPTKMPFNPMQMMNQSYNNQMIPQNTSNVGMHHGNGNLFGKENNYYLNKSPMKQPFQKSFLEQLFNKRSLTEMAYLVILYFIFNTNLLHTQMYKFLPQLYKGTVISKVGIVLYGIILAVVFILLRKFTLPF